MGRISALYIFSLVTGCHAVSPKMVEYSVLADGEALHGRVHGPVRRIESAMIRSEDPFKNLQQEEASLVEETTLTPTGNTTETTTETTTQTITNPSPLYNMDYALVNPTWNRVQQRMAYAFFITYTGLPIAFAMFFAMVSSGIPGLEVSAWKVLSGAMAFGCTELIFEAINLAWNMIFGADKFAAENATYSQIFVLSFLAVASLLRFVTSYPVLREALTIMGAYIIGFANIAFSTKLLAGASTKVFFPELFGLIVLNVVLMVLSYWIRTTFSANANAQDQASWEKYAEIFETESFAMYFGFLVSWLTRALVFGLTPGDANYPSIISMQDLYKMGGATGASLVLALAASVIYCYTHTLAERQMYVVRRSCRLITACFISIAGWHVYYFVQWLSYCTWTSITTFSTLADIIIAQMSMVLIAAFGVTFLLYVVHCICMMMGCPLYAELQCDLASVCAMVIGFSWQSTVAASAQAFATFAEHVDGSSPQFSPKLYLASIGFIEVLFLPLWAFMLLPKTLKAEKKNDEDASDSPPMQESASSQSRQEVGAPELPASQLIEPARAEAGQRSESDTLTVSTPDPAGEGF